VIITDPVDYKTTRSAVSFSWLKLFEQDEDLFHRRFIKGEIPDEEPEESRALAVGTAAHCMVLEGADEFGRRFAVTPRTYPGKGGEEKAWNRNSKICQEWEAAQEAAGKSIVSAKECALLMSMRASLWRNREAAELLECCAAEVAIRRDYSSLGFGRQGRLDAISHAEGVILDVKTIEDINDRARVREQRKYYRQLPYYADLAEEEFKQEYRQGIVWLEKSWPHRCCLEWLSPDLVAYGRAKNTESLARLAERYALGNWNVIPDTAEIGPSAEMIWDQEYA